MSATFQTGIEFNDDNNDKNNEAQRRDMHSVSANTSQLSSMHQKAPHYGERLPSSVNLVALRESFLSEAPFISNSNRTFWRRMVDNGNFQILLAASYYIIADCVSDNSVVDVEKLQDIDIESTPLIKTMATNISEMYYTIKLRERELLFAKLPEVLSFMALTALRTAIPKHHRLCLSAKFREMLIDWYCEVIGGLRFTNCRTNREWLFTDVFDAQIVTKAQLKGQGTGNSSAIPGVSNSNSNDHNSIGTNMLSNPATNGAAGGGIGATGISVPSSGTSTDNNTISVSKQTIGLSPLVSKYTSDTSLTDLQVKISLSHLSNRTLISLDTTPLSGNSMTAHDKKSTDKGAISPTPPPPNFRPGRPRLKKVDYEDVRRVVKTSSKNRRKIMASHNRSIRESNHELNKSRNELKEHLCQLKKTQSTEMLKARTSRMSSSSFANST